MTYQLIWTYGKHTEVIITGNKALCMWKKNLIRHESQFKTGKLIIK